MSNTPFEQFFHGKFQTMLEAVGDVPGLLTADFPLSQSSWDRKAAYLLWTALGNKVTATPAADPRQTDIEDVTSAPVGDSLEDILG